MGRTRKSSGGRRRAVAGLTAAGLLVFALLTVFAIELSDTQQQSRRDVMSRVHERSVLAAALIDSLFQTVRQQVPQLEARYGGPHVSSRVLDAARQQNAYLAVLDQAQHVLAASHGFTPQARADLKHSAALALVRAGRSYAVGNVLPYGRTGVINLAIVFPTRYGRRILLTGLPPRSMTGFLTGDLRRIPGVKGAHNYVIDGDDVVLATTNPARPPGYRFSTPAQRAALSRPSGSSRGRYYDQVPISNSTWRILLAAPSARLFASVAGLGKWLPWLIFGAFALVAMAALLLGSRVVRSAESRLRKANTQLTEVNLQLEQVNESLAHDALHDPLTQLPNRALLMDRMDQMLQRSARDAAIGCAVLFIDLDGFKPVNDSFSHAVGDLLLVAVARRFQTLLRPGDTVARLGGDEFAVLLDSVVTEEDATAVAERVHESLKESFDVAGHELFVRASVGIALQSPGVSAADLLRNADIAMYDAKRRRTGGYVIFDETMRRRVVDRLALENELRTAIEESALGVHYQPIVDLSTGQLRGLEALARWPNGGRGVSPLEFIPVAEESGLIRALGRHVLHQALGTLATWRARGLVGDDVYVSVNISRRQLDDPALPGDILSALADSGVPAEALRLEITESMLMQEPQRIQRIVSDVCAHGVALHLDDFGTQYSSLAALLQFPVVALKIDRSFITSAISENTGTGMIVRTIISLAHGLGLRAIGEGVETPDELERLTEMGCDWGQGFLFARPLDREQLDSVLAGWSPLRSRKLSV
ncbi:MAG: putative bifunctional diguanylate cyclase/phosphodiesterase [Solirubrobacteraceae bacterium]